MLSPAPIVLVFLDEVLPLFRIRGSKISRRLEAATKVAHGLTSRLGGGSPSFVSMTTDEEEGRLPIPCSADA